MVSVAHLAPGVDLSVADHAAPGEGTGFGVRRDESLVPDRTNAGRVPGRHHHGGTATPHQFLTDVRLAAAATAERFVPMNGGAFFTDVAIGYEEPLALSNGRTAFGLGGPEALHGGAYIVNVFARNSGGEPMTFIAAKQEFVLVPTVAHHKHEMSVNRLDVENLGYNPCLATDVKEFTAAVPADVNPDLCPLPLACVLYTQTRAHAGEVPAEELLGRHTTPKLLVGRVN
ncbi:hypothetical protein [uncultured Paludibaculum sp.]|uniref:hypothetical protein n=1 Tax=uncultured Paludibaculum sp. TaxID=1765020 RepID=UPI002AAB226A|nr:hypothetical protein [uncultured Paludibaculum sp.]